MKWHALISLAAGPLLIVFAAPLVWASRKLPRWMWIDRRLNFGLGSGGYPSEWFYRVLGLVAIIAGLLELIIWLAFMFGTLANHLLTKGG